MIVGTEEVVLLAFLSNPLVAILITKGSVIGQGYDETMILKFTIPPANTLHDILPAPTCLPAVGPGKAYFASEEQKTDKGVQV